MKTALLYVAMLSLSTWALAQAPAGPQTPAPPPDDISGMYTFLQEGEYLQLNIEDQGKVTGVVSRFGDLDSDRGVFLDHLLEKGALQDDRLTFTTRAVHGVWYEFKGKVVRAKDKKPGDEGYCLLRGKLTQYTSDQDKNTSAKSRQVEFKSFPADVSQ